MFAAHALCQQNLADKPLDLNDMAEHGGERRISRCIENAVGFEGRDNHGRVRDAVEQVRGETPNIQRSVLSLFLFIDKSGHPNFKSVILFLPVLFLPGIPTRYTRIPSRSSIIPHPLAHRNDPLRKAVL